VQQLSEIMQFCLLFTVFAVYADDKEEKFKAAMHEFHFLLAFKLKRTSGDAQSNFPHGLIMKNDTFYKVNKTRR
jgi:hypothetical protein